LDEPNKINIDTIKGNIEFKNVQFAYPNNESKLVLNSINL